MKTAARKRNIPMFAAGVLLCLTLLTLYMVSGLFAKYTTSASVGDSARVAAFYLDADSPLLQYLQAEVIPGEAQKQNLQIINKSEVKMEYTLTIQKETDNLPLTLLLKNTDTSEVYSSSANGTITVTQTLPPRAQTDHYTLEISWPAGVGAEDPNLAFMGMLDSLRVTVSAEQVD